MTAAASDTELLSLRKWAATTGVIEAAAMHAADWPCRCVFDPAHLLSFDLVLRIRNRKDLSCLRHSLQHHRRRQGVYLPGTFLLEDRPCSVTEDDVTRCAIPMCRTESTPP
ncbi:hypothetical protein ACFV8E_09555 [Streptomyces sp. NPDC059849]|uniref:hypothetical protein n=1 Tax=Streptomyces sp. NPDC059849 TaxID=3346969 RepID=UPI0036617887